LAAKHGAEKAPQVEPATPAEKPVLASVSGVITDDHGEPLPEVRVKLKSGDAGEREVITNAQGRYSFAAVPRGTAELEASAVGFATQTWSVQVAALDAEQPTRGLKPKATTGVVRGLVRSFQSQPLRAHVVVRNLRGKTISEADSNAEGRVEIELAPGRYRVTIDVPGYKSHVQTIRVKGNDVSVLNADLRKEP
jgi:5-hydroxyisourate hydrolase-like protein (transthyretin family)